LEKKAAVEAEAKAAELKAAQELKAAVEKKAAEDWWGNVAVRREGSIAAPKKKAIEEKQAKIQAALSFAWHASTAAQDRQKIAGNRTAVELTGSDSTTDYRFKWSSKSRKQRQTRTARGFDAADDAKEAAQRKALRIAQEAAAERAAALDKASADHAREKDRDLRKLDG